MCCSVDYLINKPMDEDFDRPTIRVSVNGVKKSCVSSSVAYDRDSSGIPTQYIQFNHSSNTCKQSTQ